MNKQKICKDCGHFHPIVEVDIKKNKLIGYSPSEGFCSENEDKKIVKNSSKACKSFEYINSQKKLNRLEADRETFKYFSDRL